MNLTERDRRLLVGIYEVGGHLVLTLSQKDDIILAHKLQDLGLVSLVPSVQSRTTSVHLTEEGQNLASNLKSRGFESSYRYT